MTVHERLQAFYSQHPDFLFSRKKTRVIAKTIAYIWDRKQTNPPITYTQSIEPGGVFNVRSYPDIFQKTIDAIILRIYNSHISNLAAEAKNVSREMEGTPKKKRQPVAKMPVYSSSTFKNQNQ
jgi:hypothetical protein